MAFETVRGDRSRAMWMVHVGMSRTAVTSWKPCGHWCLRSNRHLLEFDRCCRCGRIDMPHECPVCRVPYAPS